MEAWVCASASTYRRSIAGTRHMQAIGSACHFERSDSFISSLLFRHLSVCVHRQGHATSRGMRGMTETDTCARTCTHTHTHTEYSTHTPLILYSYWSMYSTYSTYLGIYVPSRASFWSTKRPVSCLSHRYSTYLLFYQDGPKLKFFPVGSCREYFEAHGSPTHTTWLCVFLFSFSIS